MPIPWGAIAAGAAPVVGGIINSALSASSANKQMRFQERMSSTAHQREVEDLRKAGLNPLLSLKSGGASSPPGARSEVDIGVEKGVTSALQASQVKSQINLQEAQANQANSAAALSNATAKSIGDTLPHTVEKLKAEVGQVLAGTAVSQAMVPEIAQRISESIKRMELLEQQKQTEAVRLQKEKAFQALWKALEDIIGKTDATLRDKVPIIMEKIKPMLPWFPGGALFMERR